MPEEKKEVRLKPVIRAYTRATLKYPWLFGVIVGTEFITQAVSVISPLFLKQFIDLISENAASQVVVNALYILVAILAAFAIADLVSRRIQASFLAKIETRVMADLANRAFSYLIRHGHDFFISNFTGTLTRRVTRYARAYEQILDSIAFNFLPATLFCLGIVIVLYMRSPLLGLSMLLWVLLFVYIQLVMTRRRQPLRAARVAADSKMAGTLADSIGNHPTVSLFASEKYESNLFGTVVEMWRHATQIAWDADNVMRLIQNMMAVVIQIGLLLLGVYLWREGTITVGDFVLIQTYVLGVMGQVWNIGNVLRRSYDAIAEASEMEDIFELPHSIQDTAGAKALDVEKGRIEFKDVLFHFTSDKPILSDFNLSISGGERVALVGPSGAGKTTVTKLILRLYDPIEGTIEIDGQNIRQVTQESLRSAIAFVPQEPILFHRTIKENIAYGKKGATMEEIVTAAAQAHCHEFISALPQGYETYVGERGVKLSGGERQRVAIARAILKNAPILILDEATSSLDSESEALIQDALSHLMRGKTVIAIAHRLSTIMKMDRIIVMDKGKVILTGSHTELISGETNLYKKLWEIQAGGFLGGAEDDEE